jgi:RNA polymerase sigma factor (sigma-70 family)
MSFPHTRHSLLTSVRDADPDVRARALDGLVELYWKPVYKYLRLKWSLQTEDAEDLTQEFFARVVQKDTFAGYDPSKAKFRTYLRVCLDRFAVNAHRSSRAEKRGGRVVHAPLDFETAERELAAAPATPGAPDPDAFFRREWVRALFELAVEDLAAACRASGKEAHFALFERYDLDRDPDERITYQSLATEFDLPVTHVTNYLAWARRELRRLVLERLSAVSASPEEFRAEARDLFGVEPE